MNNEMRNDIRVVICLGLLVFVCWGTWKLVSNNYFRENLRPCIINYHYLDPVYHSLQKQLHAKDGTAMQQALSDSVTRTFREHDGIFTDSQGIEYLVPVNCWVEYNGFSVVLWQKPWEEILEKNDQSK